MASKPGTWWKKIRPFRGAMVVAAIVLVVGIVLIVVTYRFAWTGFTGKTLWDWLQLLIVPLVLVIGGFWLSQLQKTTEQRSTRDNQHEAALQAYIDNISELLLKEHLGERTADGTLQPAHEHVRNVARVRTLTVLTQLNARRMGYVFTFLREAGLMSMTTDDNAVSLSEADLRAVNWNGARLASANLSHANINYATLREADFGGADFSGAARTEADLGSGFRKRIIRVSILEAGLPQADFLSANLCGAHLREADLSRASLWGTNLIGAELIGANLNDASLRYANLSGANLLWANLSGANLSG